MLPAYAARFFVSVCWWMSELLKVLSRIVCAVTKHVALLS